MEKFWDGIASFIEGLDSCLRGEAASNIGGFFLILFYLIVASIPYILAMAFIVAIAKFIRGDDE